MRNYRVASLFSGCGGTDLGMIGGFWFGGKFYDSNPAEICYANDNDSSACEIFNENFIVRADNRDVRDVDSSEIPDVDILTGGFPCQSFSIIAQNPPRLGIKEELGQLFFEMCRILEDKKPLCFVAENVKGILSANKHMAFPLILNEFQVSGYKVSYKLLNAANFGVPQRRERVFIVGFRNDLNVDFNFPREPITEPRDYMPLSVALEDNVPDKYFFSEKAVNGMLRRRHKMNSGRAQDISKPCNTVGSHLAKVSLNSTDPVLFQNGKFRRFTPREVARIQSFPDNFQLVGSDSSQYRALGNAIPPVLFWHIAKAIFSHLEIIKGSN